MVYDGERCGRKKETGTSEGKERKEKDKAQGILWQIIRDDLNKINYFNDKTTKEREERNISTLIFIFWFVGWLVGHSWKSKLACWITSAPFYEFFHWCLLIRKFRRSPRLKCALAFPFRFQLQACGIEKN